jgi:hypothetical protein
MAIDHRVVDVNGKSGVETMRTTKMCVFMILAVSQFKSILQVACSKLADEIQLWRRRRDISGHTFAFSFLLGDSEASS